MSWRVLKTLLKRMSKSSAFTIDDFTFRLHYRYTVSLLIFGSILLSGNQFFGSPILCKSHTTKDDLRAFESICYANGTSLLQQQFEDFTDEAKMEDNTYYHWVSLVLLIQALIFYAPHMLWKEKWERKLMKKMVSDRDFFRSHELSCEPNQSLNVDMSQLNYDVNKLVKKLKKRIGRKFVWTYALCYFICEVINLWIIVVQILFLNFFLGSEFVNYGLNVLKYFDDPTTIPLTELFPIMTKYTTFTPGSSGDLQKQDHSCLLPQNNINNKLFAFYWFWFHIVQIISCINVLYRLLVILFPSCRLFIFKMYRLTDSDKMKIIVNRTNYADWFLIYQIRKNLNQMFYSKVLNTLADELARINEPNEFNEENDSEDGRYDLTSFFDIFQTDDISAQQMLIPEDDESSHPFNQVCAVCQFKTPPLTKVKISAVLKCGDIICYECALRIMFTSTNLVSGIDCPLCHQHSKRIFLIAKNFKDSDHAKKTFNMYLQKLESNDFLINFGEFFCKKTDETFQDLVETLMGAKFLNCKWSDVFVPWRVLKQTETDFNLLSDHFAQNLSDHPTYCKLCFLNLPFLPKQLKIYDISYTKEKNLPKHLAEDEQYEFLKVKHIRCPLCYIYHLGRDNIIGDYDHYFFDLTAFNNHLRQNHPF